jgi:hypothetical protein
MFKRPVPKRNSPPSSVPSAVVKSSRQRSEPATVYSSPEPKRLDFAAAAGSNSKSDDDQVMDEKSESDEMSTPQCENVVLRMPHQLQEALRKTA